MAVANSLVLQAHSVEVADLSLQTAVEVKGSHNSLSALPETMTKMSSRRESASEEGQSFLRCSPGQLRSSSLKKTLLCIRSEVVMKSSDFDAANYST